MSLKGQSLTFLPKMPTFYLDILNSNQARVFPQLTFLEKDGFYLAGGTALALEIGHRTSLDFDFYNPKHFSSPQLFSKIEQKFGNRTKKLNQQKDTLICMVEDVDLSFFWYSHHLIEKPVICKGIPLANLQDITAMKLLAVGHRPAQRDYIDVFYLLKKFTLEEMFSFAHRKYPNFNSYHTLRALTYFEDLGKPKDRQVKVLDPDFSWERTKDEIFEKVKKYQLSMLKKHVKR